MRQRSRRRAMGLYGGIAGPAIICCTSAEVVSGEESAVSAFPSTLARYRNGFRKGSGGKGACLLGKWKMWRKLWWKHHQIEERGFCVGLVRNNCFYGKEI